MGSSGIAFKQGDHVKLVPGCLPGLAPAHRSLPQAGTSETGYLHIDETHVQVLKEPGWKNTSDFYMWVYCSIKEQKILSGILSTSLGGAENIRKHS